MKQYSASLITRLKSYSESLDNIALFQEKTWTYFDKNNSIFRYIFLANKELIISKNGIVNIAKWDYISSSKFLLIKTDSQYLLLNQNYVDKGAMILQTDGTNEMFILMDENIIPDLNLENYLKKVFYKKYNVKLVNLNDGIVLEIVNGLNKENYFGLECLVDTKAISNGYYQDNSSGKAFRIENSRISRVTVPILYNTRDGREIVIDQLQFNKISIGDFVFDTELKSVPDDKYQISFFKSIYVEDGIIIRISGI
jgi:hypothetical protein